MSNDPMHQFHIEPVSWLPPLHIAVVRRSDILPDLIDFWNRMKPLPSTQRSQLPHFAQSMWAVGMFR